MRVYVPSTLTGLATAVSAGFPAAEIACAVTPALREWYRESDTEELEFAAADEAARASLRLLARSPDDVPCRVVIAVDVPDEAVRPDADAGRAGVRITRAVPWSQVASLLVDDRTEAATAVRAGTAALAAADAGDEAASFVVDSVEDHDLLWYAAQEVDDLI